MDLFSSDNKAQAVLRTVLTSAVVASLLGLVVTLEVKRQQTESSLASVSQTEEQEVNTSSAPNHVPDPDLADTVLEQLQEHYYIPPEVEPTVASIIDAEKLRSTHEFYAGAENGDFLIITGDRAILYDAKRGKVKQVVPLELDTEN